MLPKQDLSRLLNTFMNLLNLSDFIDFDISNKLMPHNYNFEL